MAECNICEICKSTPGRYTCPRCNIFYCSTTCYQSEGHLDCSEGFFKDCVDEMLQSTSLNNEKKQNIEELLKRVNDLNEIDEQLLDSDDESNDDESNITSLNERLKDVDLDDSKLVWSKLTEEEKKGYFNFLQSGELSEALGTLWQPFWSEKFNGKVVEVTELENLKKNCPNVIKIKDFKQISNKPPSECVQHNLINILASYAFTTRYFNGDHFKEASEAISCISKISLVFKSNHRFNNFDEAFKSVIYEYKNVNWIEASVENEKMLSKDLEDILQGPHITERKFYILSCLSDLSMLFKKVLKGGNKAYDDCFEREFGVRQIEFEPIERIKVHRKKIDYYLSYVKDLY